MSKNWNYFPDNSDFSLTSKSMDFSELLKLGNQEKKLLISNPVFKNLNLNYFDEYLIKNRYSFVKAKFSN